ncbi:MAG TPA: aminoglycoside phosphotransferase family protein [Mycobacteriales bacterium]|nr:aminoglycoside phosphotransferase family protein [Mycobacteriales bacterium]
MTSVRIDVPEALAASHAQYNGAAGRAWIAALPDLAREFLERWSLRPDGAQRHGAVSLVLPVLRADGTPAALKLQPVDEESVDEPVALRIWAGRDSVRLLEYDAATGTMLLERLDAARPLSSVPDHLAALQILAEMLARLSAYPAPPAIRRLGDIAAAMLEEATGAVAAVSDPAERKLVQTCAGAVAELNSDPGDRLLHWDLHYDNILSAERAPWLAIDPKPLAGDPGFELLPALGNRWDDIVATGDVERAVLRRFDLLTEVVGLDRRRATGWTLGRILQNALWDIGAGASALDPAQVLIAGALLHRRSA